MSNFAFSRRVNKLVFDFDGVVARHFYVEPKEKLTYSGKTIRAGMKEIVAYLKSAGVEVAVLSGSKTPQSQAVSKACADHFGMSCHFTKTGQSKIDFFMENGWWSDQVAYIGDDIGDYEFRAISKEYHRAPEVAVIGKDFDFYDLPGVIYRSFARVLDLNVDTLFQYELMELKGTNRKALIHQQYSMRSYQTDKYRLMCDGNFAVIRGCIERAREAGIDTDITVTTPAKDRIEDVEAFNNWCEFNGVSALTSTYGMNAAENYSVCRLDPKVADKFSLIFSYFAENVRPSDKRTKVVFVANVSPSEYHTHVPESREGFYRGGFGRSSVTWIWNKCQEPWFFRHFSQEMVREKVRLAKGLFDGQRFLEEIKMTPRWSTLNFEAISAFVKTQPLLYFPYRISDSDYEIDEHIKFAQTEGKRLLVTDPNNTAFDSSGRLQRQDRSKHLVHVSEFAVDRDNIDLFAAHREICSAILEIDNSRLLKGVVAGDVSNVYHTSPLEVFTVNKALTGNDEGFDLKFGSFIK